MQSRLLSKLFGRLADVVDKRESKKNLERFRILLAGVNHRLGEYDDADRALYIAQIGSGIRQVLDTDGRLDIELEVQKVEAMHLQALDDLATSMGHTVQRMMPNAT